MPEPAEVETVSLEEADAEAQGAQEAGRNQRRPTWKRKMSRSTRRLDDDTFIEEQEEEDADVTDIIGGDIEPEEEG